MKKASYERVNTMSLSESGSMVKCQEKGQYCEKLSMVKCQEKS